MPGEEVCKCGLDLAKDQKKGGKCSFCLAVANGDPISEKMIRLFAEAHYSRGLNEIGEIMD